MGLKVVLLEFPLQDHFKKQTDWNKRESAIYYHGRILPGKVSLRDVQSILNAGIKVVMRGPICKKYWIEEEIEGKKYETFRENIQELNNSFSNFKILPETHDDNIIIEDLNRYKFYFTLSNSEAFNVALQEAIACGTIPIVRTNQAYWWACHMYLSFNKVEDLIMKYSALRNNDLEEYSDVISQEIKKRCSFEAIREKYKKQLKLPVKSF